MTVKELKEKLEKFDDEAIVNVWDEHGEAVEANGIWAHDDGGVDSIVIEQSPSYDIK